MAKYTVEITCRVPQYLHVRVEAETAEEAQRLALAADLGTQGEPKFDFECAGPDYVTGVWLGELAHYGEYLPIEPALAGEDA